MSHSALRTAWSHPLRYFVSSALSCLLAIDCSGHAINLGNSAGDGQQSAGAPSGGQYSSGAAGAFCQNAGAPNSDGTCTYGGAPSSGAANACSGLSCVTPCGYTSDVENGGATGVLFCNPQGECVSILPQCHGDSGGAGSAATAGAAAVGIAAGGALADGPAAGGAAAGASFAGGSTAGSAGGAGSGGI